MDIRVLRKAKGLTLQELADRTGSSKSYIWEVESNNCKPSGEKLAKIAQALDVTVDYLLTGQDVDELPRAKDEAFYRQYLGLTKDQKRKMRQLLEIIQ